MNVIAVKMLREPWQIFYYNIGTFITFILVLYLLKISVYYDIFYFIKFKYPPIEL